MDRLLPVTTGRNRPEGVTYGLRNPYGEKGTDLFITSEKKLITKQQKAASSPANYFADIEVRLRYPAPGFELAE